MMNEFVREIAAEGFNFIDIGSSGQLDSKWHPLRPLINIVGFDPNEQDCAAQNSKDLGFKSQLFLPHAVADTVGARNLYITRSAGCYSLLKPRKEWLDRFSFHELFDVLRVESLNTVRLCDIPELKGRLFDIVKLDVQGLELPILKTSHEVLKSVFYLETENGFTQNYEGETTFAEIDLFLRENDFLMFDINTTHRVSRSNRVTGDYGPREQLLWAESVWLRDWVAVVNKHGTLELTRAQALKSLLICAFEGCYSFGVELASLFAEFKLVTRGELDRLHSQDAWVFS